MLQEQYFISKRFFRLLGAGSDQLVHFIQFEHFADTGVDVGIGTAALIAPTGSVGLAAVITNSAVRMQIHDIFPGVPFDSGFYGAQLFQRQLVQSGDILNLGKAEVNMRQTGAALQRGDILDITAVGQLQEDQLGVIGERRQVINGAAGKNDDFQIRHVGDEIDVSQLLVVTHVDILGFGAVFERLTVVIVYMVHSPDGIGVGEPAALPYVDAPDNFCPGIVLTNLAQHLVVKTLMNSMRSSVVETVLPKSVKV